MEEIEQKEQSENRGGLDNIQKAQLLFAVALATLSLNPKDVKAMANQQEPTPITQPLREYGPYMTEEEKKKENIFYTTPPACYTINVDDAISISAPTEAESRMFDNSVCDISEWDNMGIELEDVEMKRKDYTIEVNEPTKVFSIPVLQSTFIHRRYNDRRPVKEYIVPEGSLYKITEVRELLGDGGENLTIGLISNGFTQQEASVIIMSAQDRDGNIKNFISESVVSDQERIEQTINNTVSLSYGDDVKKYHINGEYSEIFDLLHNPENLEPIEEFIKDDEVVQSFIELRDLFREYDLKINDLPKYLMESDWYEEMVEKNGVGVAEETLRIPYYVRIYKQPLQCVGFVEMMEELYPELNILDISSGNTSHGAQSLIPGRLFAFRRSETPGEIPYLKDGIGIGGNALKIDEYERGDLFIIHGGEFGHIGLILGKYEVNGRKVLLLADSNKLEDGRVRLYIVNEENIDNMLGKQRFVVRKLYK